MSTVPRMCGLRSADELVWDDAASVHRLEGAPSGTVAVTKDMAAGAPSESRRLALLQVPGKASGPLNGGHLQQLQVPGNHLGDRRQGR